MKAPRKDQASICPTIISHDLQRKRQVILVHLLDSLSVIAVFDDGYLYVILAIGQVKCFDGSCASRRITWEQVRHRHKTDWARAQSFTPYLIQTGILLVKCCFLGWQSS